MVGEFDVIHRPQLLLFHLPRQKRDGGGGGLRLGTASGECRVAVQSVFIREVPQGKTIAKHHRLIVDRFKKVPELLVELHELPGVVRRVGPIVRRMIRVQLRHPLTDGCGDFSGVDRGSPDVLVILQHLAGTVIAFLFSGHPLGVGLFL